VPETCTTVQGKLDDEISQLADLNNLNEDLNRKFKTQLEEDLNTQSEGLLDELHHDAAVKIAYARRKLAIAISAKQTEITGLKKDYCQSCRLAEIAKPKQTEFCEICSGREECRNYKPRNKDN